MPAATQGRSTTVTVAEALAEAKQRLLPVSDSPRTDADVLLEHCCGIGRAAALAHPERALDEAEYRSFAAAVRRRAEGVPVAYITGVREFYSLQFRVTPAVLVPRPDTEIVVDSAARIAGSRACRIVDLGTGSGAIALALKQVCPAADVTGVDIDAAALDVARTNARELSLDVDFVESNWLDALGGPPIDLIVSNPPYVRSGDPHFAGPLRHEPRLALDGGADGLGCYRHILEAARTRLAAGGSLVLEHGYDQREPLGALASAYGFHVTAVADDLAGQPRVIVLAADGRQ